MYTTCIYLNHMPWCIHSYRKCNKYVSHDEPAFKYLNQVLWCIHSYQKYNKCDEGTMQCWTFRNTNARLPRRYALNIAESKQTGGADRRGENHCQIGWLFRGRKLKAWKIGFDSRLVFYIRVWWSCWIVYGLLYASSRINRATSSKLFISCPTIHSPLIPVPLCDPSRSHFWIRTFHIKKKNTRLDPDQPRRLAKHHQLLHSRWFICRTLIVLGGLLAASGRVCLASVAPPLRHARRTWMAREVYLWGSLSWRCLGVRRQGRACEGC